MDTYTPVVVDTPTGEVVGIPTRIYKKEAWIEDLQGEQSVDAEALRSAQKLKPISVETFYKLKGARQNLLATLHYMSFCKWVPYMPKQMNTMAFRLLTILATGGFPPALSLLPTREPGMRVLPAWNARAITASLDEPKHVAWAAKPQYVFDVDRRKRGKISKVLNRIEDLTDYQIRWDDFARYFPMFVNAGEYRCEIVKGDAILHYYYDRRVDTCMTASSSADAYAKNDSVSLLVCFDAQDEFRGRALVWHGAYSGGKEVTMMDFVYPDSGWPLVAMYEFAHQHGWQLASAPHPEEIEVPFYHDSSRAPMPHLDNMRPHYKGDVVYKLTCPPGY